MNKVDAVEEFKVIADEIQERGNQSRGEVVYGMFKDTPIAYLPDEQPNLIVEGLDSGMELRMTYPSSVKSLRVFIGEEVSNESGMSESEIMETFRTGYDDALRRIEVLEQGGIHPAKIFKVGKHDVVVSRESVKGEVVEILTFHSHWVIFRVKKEGLSESTILNILKEVMKYDPVDFEKKERDSLESIKMSLMRLIQEPDSLNGDELYHYVDFINGAFEDLINYNPFTREVEDSYKSMIKIMNTIKTVDRSKAPIIEVNVLVELDKLEHLI